MAALIFDEFDMEEDMMEELDVDEEDFEEDMDGVEVDREFRKYPHRLDPFREYNEREFKQRYRLTKPLVQVLANRIAELGITGPMAGIGNNLTPELTVSLCHLRE